MRQRGLGTRGVQPGMLQAWGGLDQGESPGWGVRWFPPALPLSCCAALGSIPAPVGLLICEMERPDRGVTKASPGILKFLDAYRCEISVKVKVMEKHSPTKSNIVIWVGIEASTFRILYSHLNGLAQKTVSP